MALRKNALTEEVVLPVDGFDALVEIQVVEHAELFVERIQCAFAAQGSILVVRHDVLVSVENVHTLGNGFCLQVTVVVHNSLTTLSVLRRDENYTVGTLRTVDGCRGSILQHRDVFDVVRRKVAQLTTLETVDNDQWRVVTRDRTATTNANQHFCVGRTVSRCDVHTGHLTSQGFRHVGDRNLHKVLSGDCSHRTRQVFLPAGTVTDDHNVVQRVVFVFKNHVDGCLSLDIHFFCFHTDV